MSDMIWFNKFAYGSSDNPSTVQRLIVNGSCKDNNESALVKRLIKTLSRRFSVTKGVRERYTWQAAAARLEDFVYLLGLSNYRRPLQEITSSFFLIDESGSEACKMLSKDSLKQILTETG
jgi:hypothetical protein